MAMPRLLVALAWLLWAAAPAVAAPAAPAFTLRLLDGGTLDSRSLIGKKVLVVRFQASWCKICAQEAAGVQRVWTRYGPAGVEVVGVQVQDTEADARRFRQAHGATYPGGLDPHLQIANRFGAKGTPYTVVINRRGEITARLPGRADEARLARAIEPLLAQPPKRTPPRRLQ
jgi:cytochrome c biogenesis protein CcmG/thiol:disulfide interchange protein DsbE